MKTILLIEENTTVSKNIQEVLDLGGYSVLHASDGRKGLKTAMELFPDLILADIQLPNLDGFGVLNLLLKRPEFIHTPIILLSQNFNLEEFRKAMEMGANDYLAQPFSDTDILNAVETQLKKAKRIKNLSLSSATPSFNPQYDYNKVLDELKVNAATNTYRKKQVIFTEGNFPQYLFYIKKGKVKALKTNEDGKELTVGLYSEGDFIGYIALLENSGYRISAIALEDSELLLIPREDFLDRIKTNAVFALAFTRVLADKNNYKAEQMVQLAYNSLRKRVANTLVLLVDRFPSEKEELSIKMTREELANLSGTTTESLIRTISDFRSEGLIEIIGRKIKILNRDRLKNMLN